MMDPNTIGEQLMRLRPANRRCPQCLRPISVVRGCRNRGIPTCEKCGFYPRGAAVDADMQLVLDSAGNVTGWVVREPDNA